MNEISLLLDQNYIDEFTESLTTSMVLFNRKNDIFSFVEVVGTRVPNSIRWRLRTHVYTIDPVVYSRDGKDVSRSVMEILYFVSLFLLILRELYELREAIKHNGNIAGTLIYATNFGNILDCGSYAVQVISNIAWLNFALMARGWEPQLDYAILKDPASGHSYFKAGDSMLDCVQVFNDVTEFSKASTLHKTMASVSLILCCIQMIKNLDFHPRMGLITRTISNAAGTMFFFFILFFMVVLVYAFMGTIQYGSSMEEFRSLGVSIEFLFFMLLGEFFDTREGMDEQSNSVNVMFFWTFMMICYFILINAFLAIIVEAYEKTKGGFDAISYTDAIFGLGVKIQAKVARLWRKPRPEEKEFHLKAVELKAALQWILGLYDEEMKEEDMPDLFHDTERWAKYKLSDIPNAGRAMVIRKRDGDNAEDGTVTETGERIFFSQSHLFRALTNAHKSPSKHNVNCVSNEVLAMLISYNVLRRFGMLADVNDDGEITNSEILSLKADARHGGNAMNFATVALASKAKQLASQADLLTTGALNTLHGSALTTGVGGARRMTEFGGNVFEGGFGLGHNVIGGVKEGVGGLGHNVMGGVKAGVGNMFHMGRKFPGAGIKVERSRNRRMTAPPRPSQLQQLSAIKNETSNWSSTTTTNDEGMGGLPGAIASPGDEEAKKDGSSGDVEMGDIWTTDANEM